MKQVCHTNVALTSKSLMKNICYPEVCRFTTKATQWGCTHKNAAREHYVEVTKEKHIDLCVTECGLILNPKWPHLGASPDGTVQCSCCKKGTL